MPSGRGRGSPSVTRSTGSPAARTRATRSGTAAMPGCGSVPWRSVSSRRTPSRRRSSLIATRPVSAIPSNRLAAASSPTASAPAAPASACTTTMLTWWATTSCSSRAIRCRSCTTASAARVLSLGLAGRAPLADLVADQQGAERRKCSPVVVLEARVAGEQGGDHHADGEDHDDDHRRTAAALRRHGVEGDERGDLQGWVGLVGDAVGHVEHADDERDRQRPRPAPGEREPRAGEHRRAPPGQVVLAGIALLGGERADDEQRGDRHGQDRVTRWRPEPTHDAHRRQTVPTGPGSVVAVPADPASTHGWSTDRRVGRRHRPPSSAPSGHDLLRSPPTDAPSGPAPAPAATTGPPAPPSPGVPSAWWSP